VASLTVGSLFSGIGGIDLGLERAGHRIVWHSEIDKYATRVLAKWWPDVPNLGDITKIEWNPEEHYVDIIAGGYPCQPFSTAGKRKGKEDKRHLWPYFLDAIRILRPRYALMENVRGHLTLGFGDVLADLAACGYSAEWQIIPASSVGAPHRRDRLFVVAYPNRERSHRTEVDSAEIAQSALADVAGRRETVAYPDDARDRASERTLDGERPTHLIFRHDSFDGISGRRSILADTDGRRFQERQPETESAHWVSSSGRGRHGLGEWWQTEPEVGRMANGIPARVDRLRGLGNAVVPQLAQLIGILISEHADN